MRPYEPARLWDALPDLLLELRFEVVVGLLSEDNHFVSGWWKRSKPRPAAPTIKMNQTDPAKWLNLARARPDADGVCREPQSGQVKVQSPVSLQDANRLVAALAAKPPACCPACRTRG